MFPVDSEVWRIENRLFVCTIDHRINRLTLVVCFCNIKLELNRILRFQANVCIVVDCEDFIQFLTIVKEDILSVDEGCKYLVSIWEQDVCECLVIKFYWVVTKLSVIFEWDLFDFDNSFWCSPEVTVDCLVACLVETLNTDNGVCIGFILLIEKENIVPVINCHIILCNFDCWIRNIKVFDK